MATAKNAQRSKTTEALLGMLSLGPMSGYELRQMIDFSIGNFWSESFGQIYPALKRMAAEGLIEQTGATDGRPEKRVYALTVRGRERLKEWLALPVVRQVRRNELLLKLFFGDQTDTAKMRQLIGTRRDVLTADLARYEAIEKQISEAYAGHKGLPFWLMTSRYGQAEARALLQWCNQCLETLEEMQ